MISNTSNAFTVISYISCLYIVVLVSTHTMFSGTSSPLTTLVNNLGRNHATQVRPLGNPSSS